jgi:hypothetical protein
METSQENIYEPTPSERMNSEITNLREIIESLDYDLEETRKWAVQCELELIYWKDLKNPEVQPTNAMIALKTELEECKREVDGLIQAQRDTQQVDLEEKAAFAELEEDYNTLYQNNATLLAQHKALKEQHEALLIAMGM